MVRSLDPNVDARMIRRLFDLARGGGSSKSISPVRCAVRCGGSAVMRPIGGAQARFTMIMRLRSS